MTYDIWTPNFPDISVAYFTADFFREPPETHEIIWTDGRTRGGLCTIVRGGKPCHERCMAGVLVKMREEPYYVWRLTGGAMTVNHDTWTHLISYEGKWPD